MHKKQAISEFMNINGAYCVACSILTKADYFKTTDDRLLKYQSAEVAIVTPGEFIRRLEEKRNE